MQACKVVITVFNFLSIISLFLKWCKRDLFIGRFVKRKFYRKYISVEIEMGKKAEFCITYPIKVLYYMNMLKHLYGRNSDLNLEGRFLMAIHCTEPSQLPVHYPVMT